MKLLIAAIACLMTAVSVRAQDLPARWDELTATDWPKALEKSARTAVLPIGILEKHGPHAPIGSDLIQVREIAARATKQEYAVVFPDYFYGQIYEAKHQPGAFALPSRLIWELLDATCEEIARNGFTKIVIVNGHGGNEHLLPFFAQSQLEKRHDYVVYVFDERTPSTGGPVKKDTLDMHAGESETSKMIVSRPDLVHLDRAASESGADQHHVDLPDGVYTGIWWYARFPDHYSGNGSLATRELGKFQMDWWIDSVAKVIRAVKADQNSLRLQNEFYEKTQHPLSTKQ